LRFEIDFSKLNVRERSIRRRAFWEDNQLFEFKITFTRQLRTRAPDFEMLIRKLRSLKGEAALVEEFMELLLTEAKDYRKFQLISTNEPEPKGPIPLSHANICKTSPGLL